MSLQQSCPHLGHHLLGPGFQQWQCHFYLHHTLVSLIQVMLFLFVTLEVLLCSKLFSTFCTRFTGMAGFVFVKSWLVWKTNWFLGTFSSNANILPISSLKVHMQCLSTVASKVWFEHALENARDIASLHGILWIIWRVSVDLLWWSHRSDALTDTSFWRGPSLPQ